MGGSGGGGGDGGGGGGGGGGVSGGTMRGGESLKVDTFERSPNGSNNGSSFNGSGSPSGHKGNPLRSTLGGGNTFIFTLFIWFITDKSSAVLYIKVVEYTHSLLSLSTHTLTHLVYTHLPPLILHYI